MSTQPAESKPFTIARLMIVVAAFGFVGHGLRHFLVANEPHQSGAEAVDLFLALCDLAIGGTICGFGLRTAFRGRLRANLRPWRLWITALALPSLFVSLLDDRVSRKMMEITWGTVFFGVPCVWLMCFERDPDDPDRPVELADSDTLTSIGWECPIRSIPVTWEPRIDKHATNGTEPHP